MRHIVHIAVTRQTETNDRTTFFVQLTTDEGFSTTPISFRTPSKHEIAEGKTGLDVATARDRALTEAGMWADLLELGVEAYEEDGVVFEPRMPMAIYTTRRVLKKRAEAARAARTDRGE